MDGFRLASGTALTLPSSRMRGIVLAMAVWAWLFTPGSALFAAETRPSVILIPEFHAQGETLVRVAQRLEALAQATDPQRQGIRIRVLKADADAEFADTATASLDLHFYNVPLPELVHNICRAALLDYRKEGDAYLISDGTAVLDPVQARRAFAVKPVLWEHVGRHAGGATNQDAIAAFLRSRCLPPPASARFARRDAGHTLEVVASDAMIRDCQRLLRELDYLDRMLVVRVRLQAVVIDDPSLIYQVQFGTEAMPRPAVHHVTTAPACSRAYRETTLEGAPGTHLKGTIAGRTGATGVSVLPVQVGGGRSSLLALTMAVGGDAERFLVDQRVLMWSGATFLLRLPRAVKEPAQDGQRIDCLLVTAELVEEQTGRVLPHTPSWPSTASPVLSALTEVFLPDLDFDGVPLVTCLAELVREVRRLVYEDVPLPGLGLITRRSDQRGPVTQRTMTMDMNNVRLGEALRTIAMGAGLACRVSAHSAILAEKDINLGAMTTEYLEADGQTLSALGTEPMKYLQGFGLEFPAGAALHCDARAGRIVMRNTPDGLGKLAMIVREFAASPTQLVARAILADVHDRQLPHVALSRPSMDAPLGELKQSLRFLMLLFSAREPDVVDVLHHGELITTSAVTASYRAGKKDAAARRVELAVTPALQDDGYTGELDVVWRDATREMRTKLMVWDGERILLHLGSVDRSRAPRESTPRRLLSLGFGVMRPDGRYLRAWEPIWDATDDVDGGGDANVESSDRTDRDKPASLGELCERTILDRFAIADLSVEEAVDVVKKQMTRLGPKGKEPRLFLQMPPGLPAATDEGRDDADDLDLGGFEDFGDFGGGTAHVHLPRRIHLTKRRVHLDLRHASVADVIRCLCLQTGMRSRFESGAVIIAEKSTCLCSGETRYYHVTTEFLRFLKALEQRDLAEAHTTSTARGGTVADWPDEQQEDGDRYGAVRLTGILRKAFGILGYAGARADVYPLTGKLVAHGSPADLRILEDVITAVNPLGQARIRFGIAPHVARLGDAPLGADGGQLLSEVAGMFGEPMSLTQRFVCSDEGTGRRLTVSCTPEVLHWPDMLRCRLACELRGTGSDEALLAETGGTVLVSSIRATGVVLPTVGSASHDTATELQIGAAVIDPAGRDLARRARSAAAEAEDAGLAAMRQRLAALLIHGLTFTNATLSEVVAGLRTALRRLDSQGPAGNLVLVPSLSQQSRKTPRRVTEELRFDGISALDALETMRTRFGTPYRILATAVVIGGEPPDRDVCLVDVSVSDVLGLREGDAATPVELQERLEALLRENGVLFSEGDRVFALSARPSVLAVGRPVFLARVESVLQRLRPVPIQVAVSARLLGAEGRASASYEITTVPGAVGTCAVHCGLVSRLDVTPAWDNQRQRLALVVAWSGPPASRDTIRRRIDVTPGMATTVPLTPRTASAAAQGLRITARLCRITENEP